MISLLLALFATLFLSSMGAYAKECKDPVTEVVALTSGADPHAFADIHGVKYVGQVGPLRNVHEFVVSCADGLETRRRATFATRFENDINVIKSYGIQAKRKLHPRTGEIPQSQWHLRDDAINAATAHIQNAWNMVRASVASPPLNPRREVISVVDDGLAWTNPDLRPHYSSEFSGNYNSRFTSDANDPFPRSEYDAHGTAAAGIAAAAGANGTPFVVEGGNPACGFGTDPDADLAGVRLISEAVSDATEARALAHKFENVSVYSCSWGPSDDGTRLEGPGPLTVAAIEHSALHGRNGLGSVYVWAGGNGYQNGDSCAYDGYASNPNVIAVAAAAHTGIAASYSEACASIMVSAPSSGSGYSITTTSTDPSCRSDFGGTSAAAPFVAGVVALVLRANPLLTAKDVARVLVSTARVPPVITASEWTRNAAGIFYSPRYGFGLVNADRAMQLAATMTPTASDRDITLDTVWVQGTSSKTVRISPPRGLQILVERVEVTVTAEHPRRGQLSFSLTSPSHTHADVSARLADTGANYNGWTFSFLTFWNEAPEGNWTFEMVDTVPRDRYSGRLTSWGLTIRGVKKVST